MNHQRNIFQKRGCPATKGWPINDFSIFGEPRALARGYYPRKWCVGTQDGITGGLTASARRRGVKPASSFSIAPKFALLVALVCLAQVGCVQRRMFINSNPAGATVWINDQEVGTTPLATHFPYYGTHEIRLAKDGYETLTVQQPVRPPWYEIPPFDLVSENFIPGELRDTRSFSFDLQPRMLVPKRNLLRRAEQMRQTHRFERAGGLPMSP